MELDTERSGLAPASRTDLECREWAAGVSRGQQANCGTGEGIGSRLYKDVIHPHTSAGTQLHGHEVEQVLGGVAHEL